MPLPLPISVFIIALNEADRIGMAISSVTNLAEEIIVVDSGSTDGTQEIARSLGAKVIHNDWPGYGKQKRFGEDQCKNDWLLNLDADEEVTPELAEEIRQLINSKKHITAGAWRMMIRTVFAHEQKPAPWAYGYHQIRLYNRKQGRFSPSSVHDTVRPNEGTLVKNLNGIIAHHSMPSIDFQVSKYNRYSNMQVADMRERGRHLPKYRLLTEMPFAFLKAYIVRQYWRYGFWGVIMATNYAHSRFLRIAKAYEAELFDRKK